jgi:hypothetical protein
VGTVPLSQTMIRAPNGTHAKLCGQGPRAEAAAACRLPRIPLGQRHAICNLHDAEQVLFGRGASAPGRSRAAQLQREVERSRYAARSAFLSASGRIAMPALCT